MGLKTSKTLRFHTKIAKFSLENIGANCFVQSSRKTEPTLTIYAPQTDFFNQNNNEKQAAQKPHVQILSKNIFFFFERLSAKAAREKLTKVHPKHFNASLISENPFISVRTQTKLLAGSNKVFYAKEGGFFSFFSEKFQLKLWRKNYKKATNNKT